MMDKGDVVVIKLLMALAVMQEGFEKGRMVGDIEQLLMGIKEGEQWTQIQSMRLQTK